MSKAQQFHSQQVGEIYFNLLKISNDEQKQQWHDYANNAGYVKASDGVYTFQKCLTFYNNQNTDVWVAYVSNKPIENPNIMNKNGIEMYMSVTTSDHAPFTTHMGIQRVKCDKPHKNISVSLHEFCAKTMLEFYPDKLFMFSTPQEVMREILFNSIKAAGKSDSLYIYDDGEDTIRVNKDCIARLQTQLEEAKENKYPSIKLESRLHFKEAVFDQRQKIAEKILYPHITIEKIEQQKLVKISDKGDGKLVATIESSDAEFTWFFNNYDLYALGAGGCSDVSMISVELSALSSLTDQFI